MEEPRYKVQISVMKYPFLLYLYVIVLINKLLRMPLKTRVIDTLLYGARFAVFWNEF